MSDNKINFLNDLNDAQIAPVIHKEGPLIVIAGAGSGKTRVLTYRIAYLIQKGVDPFEILSLTFTNKAAREMKERISKLIGSSEAKNLWMGTFHSVFARLLRNEADKLGFPSNFTIYDTQDSERLISSIIKEMSLEKDIYKPKQIKNRISAFKNSLITVKAYYNDLDLIQADKMARRPKMGEIYKEYVDRCFKSGAMDFDDLLLRTNELLNRFPEVLSKYQNRFKYILVDEYQDTNYIQSRWLNLLAQKNKNLCCVGDDDQSIYSWRGAEIRNFLEFDQIYENTKVIRLEQNYRSTQNILSVASQLISHNQNRVGKTLKATMEDGDLIDLNCYKNGKDEAIGVSDEVEKIKKRYSLNNVAILVRAIFQTREFEERFLKIGLPYRILGGTKFYERAEIKDCVAYLRIVHQNKDDLAFERIVNNPKRSIGDNTLKQIHEFAKNNSSNLEFASRKMIEQNLIKPKTKVGLSIFLNSLSKWRSDLENKKINHIKLLQIILDESGYSAMLKNKKDVENENRLENIKELLSAMKEFDNLESFLEHVSLATAIDQDWDGQKVNMMTMHAAKGLEFDVVFLPGWEEGLFPHQKSVEEKGQNGLEEERRLAYVGITRAKKKALISFSMNRFYQGDWIDSMASRFIDELPNDFLKKNSYFEDDKNEIEDFEFNQDLEVEDETRSPGWARYQKRIK